ncbi:MAG: ribonuclease P protein component [Bacteroidota bacterium]
MAGTYTLSKNERLKSLKAIRHLFENGQKCKASPMLVYYHVEPINSSDPEAFPLKMGVSVGARNFKKAVDRNLMKRRMREAFRVQKIPLLACLNKQGLRMDIFFVYSHALLSDYASVAQAMENALGKLISLIEKK